ncbi:TspO/MBR family protein [Sporichthya polymorpha]|uniref:TspO/MBR family protein n=1 Tax=Sporichthya polymorpha TaxID=35751 RepID=UPI0003790CA2|nr:TspO/MBR family protein [Sporichthya polymorpha]
MASTAQVTSTAPPPAGRRAGLDLGVLVLSLLLVAAVAVSGALINAGETDGWYAEADKPPATPPGWLFGPVWSILYTSMAVAAWLVWRSSGFTGARTALGLYAVQLALNAAWTPVFFGAERLFVGLVIVLALDLAILATAGAFRRHSRTAALLLVPYLAWTLFATYLNAGVAALN